VEIPKILAKFSVEDATIHPKRPYQLRTSPGPHFFAVRWTWKSDKHSEHREVGGSADASKNKKNTGRWEGVGY
jgi:hypothetical protein